MSAIAFRALASALGDIAFERADRAHTTDEAFDASRREALSQALLFNGFARALMAAASAIEAATAAKTTEIGLVEGESAVGSAASETPQHSCTVSSCFICAHTPIPSSRERK